MPCQHLCPVIFYSFKYLFKKIHLLLYSLYALDFRIAFLENLFNYALDCHLSSRTSGAVTLKSYLNNIVLCEFNEFDISSVSLQERSDLLQCIIDFLFHNVFSFLVTNLL